MTQKKGVQLRVAEAKQRDIGMRIARIDNAVLRELNLSPGDLIEITGKKSTVAKCWPAYREDEGQRIIRIDGEIRRNAGVNVGDFVTVTKAESVKGVKVVLAPYENLPIYGDISRIVKQQLLNLPVAKGDTVIIPILGMGLELKVVQTVPKTTSSSQRTLLWKSRRRPWPGPRRWWCDVRGHRRAGERAPEDKGDGRAASQTSRALQTPRH